MKKKIVTSRNVRLQIIKELGCTEATVRAALEWKSNSYQAKYIRMLALKNGGKVWMESEEETLKEKQKGGAQ